MVWRGLAGRLLGFLTAAGGMSRLGRGGLSWGWRIRSRFLASTPERPLLLFSFFLNLFLAALGLCCCTRAFSSCVEWGLLFVAVNGLVIVVASLVAGHGL